MKEDVRKQKLRNVQYKLEYVFARIEKLENAAPSERNRLLLQVKRLELENLERIESQLLRPGKLVREEKYARPNPEAL